MRITSTLTLLLLGSLFACQQNRTTASTAGAYTSVKGETMGTYYQVTYEDPQGRQFKPSFDSILVIINAELSTYVPTSTISRFNQAKRGIALDYNPLDSTGLVYSNAHFIENVKRSRTIYEDTEGYFDPTIGPLVNFWGFGYQEKKASAQVDSATIDSLMQLVGYDKIQLTADSIIKEKPDMMVDFSAIAKGYGIDVIGNFLNVRGVENYLVDIGGESLASGKSPRGDDWTLGINVPQENAAMDEFQKALPLKNQALATSGLYRNFYEVEGQKYSHIISPFSGYPERSELLSASVFAPDCATADAYATAFMVMGAERAMKKAQQKEALESYLIVSNPDGSMRDMFTEGLSAYFERIEQ